MADNATGIVLPWEQQAIRGDEMPDGLDYPDQVLYLCLRMLYAQKRMGIIDRDTAIAEKKKLLDQYRAYQFNWQMGEEWAQVIKLTELARAEFRKNPQGCGWRNGMIHKIMVFSRRKKPCIYSSFANENSLFLWFVRVGKNLTPLRGVTLRFSLTLTLRPGGRKPA